MTKELQRAMADYEEARIRYRKAVLASLNGESNGEAIREAIQSFQSARNGLVRLGAAPASGVVKVAAREDSGAWGFVRRLLQAS